MILVSNNVKGKMSLSSDVVIRINAAWVKNYAELIQIIENNADRKIYLDYPEGRTKPPKPTLTFADVLKATEAYNNITYFAVSNAESFENMTQIRKLVPDRVKIIPKIETPIGVLKVLDVCKGAATDTIMLDKEDLYTAVNKDTTMFEHFLDVLRTVCKNNNITVLELQGVVFYER